MKGWFPFTSYDFYAYLTAGMIVIAAADYAFAGSQLVSKAAWTVPSGVFWTAIAYIGGQIVAGPSALLLEHGIVRGLLGTPTEVILGLRKPHFIGRVVAALAGAREYSAFPAPLVTKIMTKAAAGDDRVGGALDPEIVFNLAYVAARSSTDCAARLDGFLNLY